MRILLDVDGVLADYVGSLFKIYNKDIPDPWPEDEYGKKEYDLNKILWKYDENNLNRIFWEDLPLYPHARHVFNILKNYDVHICTSPSQTQEAYSGRLIWLKKNYPEYPFIFCSDKSILAIPNNVLIDDCEENCEKFQIAGGRYILFPAPWNRLNCYDPIHHLEETLDIMAQGEMR